MVFSVGFGNFVHVVHFMAVVAFPPWIVSQDYFFHIVSIVAG